MKVTDRFSQLQLLAMMTAFFFSAYYLSSFYAFGKISVIPKSHIDEIFHFAPQWILIYLSSYVAPALVLPFSRSTENTNKFIYSFLTLIFITSLTFLLFPTSIPRDNYEVSADTFIGFKLLMEFIRGTDVASNCFPSFHVSSGILFACYTFEDKWKYWPVAFLWSFLVILSTLYTKQHYFWDCLGGLFYGLSVYFFFLRNIDIE